MNEVLYNQHNGTQPWWISAARGYTRPKVDGVNVPKVPNAPDDLLTVAEACAELRISKWMLNELIRSRELASIKIGRRRLIPVGAIRDLINRRQIEESAQ